jgi:hypothetical protein
LPDVPEFSWQTTAKWKGYIAKWEIKDAELFLAYFEVRSDGKEVSREVILPGRKLRAAKSVTLADGCRRRGPVIAMFGSERVRDCSRG